jgi:hypothetical protein
MGGRESCGLRGSLGLRLTRLHFLCDQKCIFYTLTIPETWKIPPNDILCSEGSPFFERGIYHQIVAADRCVAAFGLGDPADIELHGSPMYNGRDGVWRTVRDRPVREKMIMNALSSFGAAASVRLFAVVIDKQEVSPRDPIELAFEELCNRFNLFLQRINNKTPKDSQRGLLVMDEFKHERRLQAFARHFRVDGGQWGIFRNLAEVPLFVDSKASRLVQLADLVAWATWRKYEYSDGRFFDPLIRKFDSDGGVLHGLVHRRGSAECYCPACHSRRATFRG